jgi:hypothetical protein
MKTHCINLTPHESLGFVNKRVSIIWRPVEPQPLGEVTSAVYWSDGLWRIYHEPAPNILKDGSQAGRVVGLRLKSPCGKPGDVLIGREAWQIYHMTGCVIYKADIDECGQCPATTPFGDKIFVTPKGPWQSASTMPAKYARHRHIIKSVSVKRCQDVTEAEASKSCERLEISPATVGGVAVHPMTSTYQAAFKAMIDARYPKAWDANLWMWGYEVEEVA